MDQHTTLFFLINLENFITEGILVYIHASLKLMKHSCHINDSISNMILRLNQICVKCSFDIRHKIRLKITWYWSWWKIENTLFRENTSNDINVKFDFRQLGWPRKILWQMKIVICTQFFLIYYLLLMMNHGNGHVANEK